MYKSQGVPDRVALLLQPNTGHEVTREADHAAVEWFARWLEPRPADQRRLRN